MIPTIIPNYHVILIHFPLALLGMGLFIEVFSFLWRRSSLQQAGRWMILLGTLGLLPAITSGIYALYDVASHGQTAANSWSDIKQASGFSDMDWHEARQHIIFTSAAAGIALVVVVSWLGGSERWRKAAYLPGLFGLLAAMALLSAGAWRGGGMVFRQGFGVVGKQSTELESPEQGPTLRDRIEDAASPMQLHVIGAGLVMALAAGALGTGLRRSALAEEVLLERPPVNELDEKLRDDSSSRISIVGALYNPARARVVARIPASLPSARLWLTAAIVGLITVFAGLYVGGYLVWPHVVDLAHARRALGHVRISGNRREGLHVAFGAGIVVILLILTLFARVAPRKRILLGIFSLILALALAAQVWLGILLLYDGDHGSLFRFQ